MRFLLEIRPLLCGSKPRYRKSRCFDRFEYRVGLTRNKGLKPTRPMIEISITNEQKIKVALAPVTDGGKPAVLDGQPTWSVVSGDSTVEQSADGLSATLISSDTPGDTVYLVEADADLGEGIETISDTIKLHVVGARAFQLGLSASAPELK
jgi:hypothetical protein